MTYGFRKLKTEQSFEIDTSNGVVALDMVHQEQSNLLEEIYHLTIQ